MNILPLVTFLSIFVSISSQHLKQSRQNLFYENVLSDEGYPKAGDIPSLNRKIYRGVRVTIREHPYIASIRRLYSHYCMGTILTKNILITVANPIINVPISELGIVVGENYSDRGSALLTVIIVVIHEDFDAYTLFSDIALLRIYEDITYRMSVKAIRLVSPKDALHNNKAFVTGWGRCDTTGKELCLPRASRYYPDEIADPMLRSISFRISLSYSYCENYSVHDVPLQPGMMCTGHAREDDPMCPCLAVPGAPLVINACLAGLQSWGFGCGYNRDLPLIYTDIQYFQPWLIHNIPILRGLIKNNFTKLFKAMRGYKLSQWLIETRLIKPTRQIYIDKDIVQTRLDRVLATLKGTIYDIRDFIDYGNYHYRKMEMYYNIKKRVAMANNLNTRGNVQRGRPFISNETLNEFDSVVADAKHDLNSRNYSVHYEG